ncbi:MAG: molybdenum cofactor guanylyltransferase [Nitrospirota bacterium]|nr:molybdenum cofactor guanylyltransferase [Nitrospirota bacterium]
MGFGPTPFFMEKRVKFSKISGIVLGGGESRRMGCDTRRLQWEGEPFLDRVSRVMDTLFEEVLVVTAQEDYDCSHLPVRLVTDKIPQKGSLGGLYTGLIEAKNSLVFVVACDMPFLQRECISRFCLFSGTADVLVVKLSSGIQPLHARYSKRCVPIIEQMIQKEDLKIQNLVTHSDLAVEIMGESLFDDIDPYRRSFMNINTPADLEFARKTSSHPSLP